MKSKSKVSRAFRFAPVAASLTALALVAACARTNGKTPISAETTDKAADIAEKEIVQDTGWDKNAPVNMALAKRLLGASIVINNREHDLVDATVKLVFSDRNDIIVQGKIPSGSNAKAAVIMKQINEADDQKFVIRSRCVMSNCNEIATEIIEQKDAATITTTTPAATTQNPPAGDGPKGQIDMAAGLAVASAPPAAPAPTATTDGTAGGSKTPAAGAAPTVAASVPAPTAPVVPAPAAADTGTTTPPSPTAADPAAQKQMVAVAETVVTFMVSQIPAKTDSQEVKKDLRMKMKIVRSGPTEAGQKSGSIKTYEDAFQAKYGKPAPSDDVATPAPAAPATDASGSKPGAAAPAPDASAGVTDGGDDQPGAGANDPNAMAPTAASAPAPAATTSTAKPAVAAPTIAASSAAAQAPAADAKAATTTGAVTTPIAKNTTAAAK